ncbi:inosine/xanthosine triphosphatase [Gallaecimonas mangrovi]|uniref:inosine/xanthosine triphosphatase n=1 Tax=Gallaecimonas mangrovi TaxID=2291597 RepID=UPI000E1FBB6D|nr:inosine/xanthosine triphosphatase [Gallaecimonas mangrovi]
MTKAIKLIVGSTNPVKVAAAKAALAPFFADSQLQCEGVKAPSGVAEQPMTSSETRQGAINRVNWCQQHYQADFYLAMEGGVDEFEDGPATFAYVVIATTQQRSVGRSANLPLPPVIYQGLKQGEELGPLIDKLFGTTNIKHKGGAMGLLTRNQVTRQSTYQLALTLAMAPFLNAELFAK